MSGSSWRCSSKPRLTVASGVDFDDPEYGFKEEDKSSTKVRPKPLLLCFHLSCCLLYLRKHKVSDSPKANNEEVLRKLVDKCNNAVYGTMAQAVEELSIPRIKPVRPFKAYDGPLTLGDPSKYESALSIHVERFFKTKRAAAPSASTVVVRPELAGGPSQALGNEDVDMAGTDFSGVKQMRTYRVNDPDAPGGKRDVPFEELAKGYQYGRTVVPFSESDFSVTKLETKKQFTIIGFIPFSSVSSVQPRSLCDAVADET